MRTVLLLSVLSLLLAACSGRKNISPMPSQDPEAKAIIGDQVDCRTARSDIAVLKGEEVGTGKQILAGVRSALPIAAAAGILMGDYRDRVQVATGTYNADLKAKIAQIESVCGVR